MHTLYDLLEVSESASQETIKLAYDRLVLQAEMTLKDSQPEAFDNRVKVLNETYAVLGNPERRATYDQKLQVRRSRQQQGHHDRLFDGGLGEAFRDLLLRPRYIVPVLLIALIWVVWPSHNESQRVEIERQQYQAQQQQNQQLLQMAIQQQQLAIEKGREAQRLASQREARLDRSVEYRQSNYERQQLLREQQAKQREAERQADRDYRQAERDRLAKQREQAEAQRLLQSRLKEQEQSYDAMRDLRALKMGITREQLDEMENKY